jgi:hypothetical protein
VRDTPAEWEGRGHFFAAARAMRRILIEHARARRACQAQGRRGGAPENSCPRRHRDGCRRGS